MTQLTINATSAGDLTIGAIHFGGPDPARLARYVARAERKDVVYNLLVAETLTRAERIRDALDLPKDEWHVAGFGSALGMGHRYLKVVAFMPDHIPFEIKNISSHLRSLLWPEGELTFL